MIDENSEQTIAEFMTHSGPQAAMRPRPNVREMKLLCELTHRRLNAATHPPMESPKRLLKREHESESKCCENCVFGYAFPFEGSSHQ